MPVSFAVPADAYDRFMGRYSVFLSAQLADLAGVRGGERVLDVGCGPGALTAELAVRVGPAGVSAVDPSEPFVAAARARNPGFLIIPQNGEALLEDAGYRSIISVQAKEDILFGADGDGKPNPKTAVSECLGYLGYARQDGIPVIAVEYLDQSGQIAQARKRLAEQGCVAYFGPRDLASIPTGQFES